MSNTNNTPDTDLSTDTDNRGTNDRRSLLRKLAIGGAAAAGGAVLLSNGIASANNPAGSLHIINPERAYDSRQPGYAVKGKLAPNTNRVISLANGHTATGTINQVNAVPVGATAVQINITAANMTGPNFLSVTAGDKTSTTTSLVNWSAGTTQIANSITVPVDAAREIRVYCGNQTGSADILIDVFGYYI
jgi:hypothetical protein